MLPQPQIYAPPTRPGAPAISYSSIPRRLLTDLHDTPLAIGLYALIARMHLIVRAPVPLSRADVLRYDPRLKPGAVKRAFDRLLAGGWLIQTEQTKRQKYAYTPTWGHVKGAPLPWDLNDACHGRPRHIQRLMLDRNLFDICMGKLAPHAALPATITRYITAPALSLTDIGCYALTLADMPHPTPALRWLGLIENEDVRPLPSEPRLLKILSQQPLTPDPERIAPHETALTRSGIRRVGLALPLPPNPHDRAAESPGSERQPLVFVPPRLIGSVIGSVIGSRIGAADENTSHSTATESVKPSFCEHAQPITWDSLESQETGNPLQPPHASTPAAHGGGVKENANQKELPRRLPRRTAAEPPVIPATECAQLLQSINMLPTQVLELATMPIATIHAAIKDGKARPGIRDLAAWVVKLLRAQRDHGWTITPPQVSAESPEALRLAFARYAVEQEVARREGMPDDQPWFPPPEPESLHTSGAPIRLWNQVQSALKTQLTRDEFNTWIRHATLISLEQGVATIMVPTTLAQQVITERYDAMLRDLLHMYTGEALQLRVILNPNAQEQLVREIAPLAAAAPSTASAPNPQLPTPNSPHPTWIAAERWAALPIMLRAALAGSELVDGEVQGRTPYLSMLLRTRYRREVGNLVVAVE